MPSAFDEDLEARKIAAANLRSMARDDTGAMADQIASLKGINPPTGFIRNPVAVAAINRASGQAAKPDDSAIADAIARRNEIVKNTPAGIVTEDAPNPISQVDQTDRRTDEMVNKDREPPTYSLGEYNKLIGKTGASGGAGTFGWAPGPHTVQLQRGYGDEELALPRHYGEHGNENAFLAAEARRQEIAQQAEANALYESKYREALEARQIEQQAIQAQRDAYVEKQLQDLNATSEKIASTEIDPDKYWDNRGGVFGRMVSAIAVGLGQFGASLNGGPNNALNIIQEGINQNIAAQRANLQNQKDAFSVKNNLLRMNLEKYGDMEQALAATHINYIDMAKSELRKTFDDIAKGPGSEAAYQTILSGLNVDRMKKELLFTQLGHTNVGESQVEVPSVVGAGAGAGGALSREDKEFDSKLQNEPFIAWGKGGQGILLTNLPESVKSKVLDTAGKRAETLALMSDLMGAKEKAARDGLKSPTEAYKSLQYIHTLTMALAQSMSKEEGQGVIRKEEMAIQKALAGGDASALDFLDGPKFSANNAIMRRTMTAYANKFASYINSYSPIRVEVSNVRGADGVLRPKRRYLGKSLSPLFNFGNESKSGAAIGSE